MSTRIVFNGQTYDSLEAMPPEVRAKYQAVLGALGDDDRARLESALGAGAGVRINSTVRRRIRINGKDYDSVDAMPPDARALYERAMAGRAADPGSAAAAAGGAMPAPPPAIDAGDARGNLVRVLLVVAVGLAVLVWLLARR